MVALKQIDLSANENFDQDSLFTRIANDLQVQGFSIQECALPSRIAEALSAYQLSLNSHTYQPAGVGRGSDLNQNEVVRNNAIRWITADSPAGQLWLDWAAQLQSFLNHRLFLGLFSFESHFAHYAPGQFYKRHYDAFKGQANRRLSIVTYFNPQWQNEYGGELVLYKHDDDHVGIKVLPQFGTLVVFLSDEFPHEVLPASRDRYSIAGWYRVNTSTHCTIDPPD